MDDFRKLYKKNKKDAMLLAFTALSLRHIYEDQKKNFDSYISEMEKMKNDSETKDEIYILKFLEIVKEVDSYDTHIIKTFTECEKILAEKICQQFKCSENNCVVKESKKIEIKKWW